MRRIAAIQAFVLYPLMASIYLVVMVLHIREGDAGSAALNAFTVCCWAAGAGFWCWTWRLHKNMPGPPKGDPS